MKKNIILIAFILLTTLVFGQNIPQTISYQAVLRNNRYELIPDKKVQIEFKISKIISNGNFTSLDEIYKELQPATSDAEGLINVEIGKGVRTSIKTYDEINWADNLVYNVVITDGNTILAKSDGLLKFNSVPYANLAKMALKADTALVAKSLVGDINGKFVGMFNLHGGDEGFFNLGSSSSNNTQGGNWTIGTKPFNGDFNKFFENIPSTSGIEREFYIGLTLNSKAPNTNGGGNCLYPTVIDKIYLPRLAIDYISTNYPGNSVTLVTRQGNNNQSDPANCQGSCKLGVKLSNGTTLRFDKNGVFENVCSQGYCNTLKVRFFYPDLLALGHEGQISINGNEQAFGKIYWLKIPSPKKQFPNATTLKSRLELALDSDCGTEITIKEISLLAIDKQGGNQPSLSISNSVGMQEIPKHFIGGLGGKILIDENSDIVSISGRLISPQMSVGSGGIYVQGSAIVNGGVIASQVEVNGNDIIEKFKSKESIEEGTLVTIDESDINNYKMTDKAYQKGVVGIVSGANGVKHGMLLEQQDVLAGNTKVAIAGRVYVKATAQNGTIKAGDMLTSSDKEGYAMKVTNRRKAFGTVVGKALTSLETGEGFVLVMVGLQ